MKVFAGYIIILQLILYYSCILCHYDYMSLISTSLSFPKYFSFNSVSLQCCSTHCMVFESVSKMTHCGNGRPSLRPF